MVNSNSLNIQGDMVVEWGQYVNVISHSAIKLTKEEDKLNWSKDMVNVECKVKL
jgi:hypothetical protein